MGHAGCRFFSHLPANTPVQPRKINRKSLVKKSLPVSHTGSKTCPERSKQILCLQEFEQNSGRGYHQPQVQTLQPLARRLPIPCRDSTMANYPSADLMP